jgi:trimethylamine:corrinoid methyltransferase-like protein
LLYLTEIKMRPLNRFMSVLSDDEIEKLHENALKLLEDPGMRIENEEALKALDSMGAKVDLQAQIVRFPRKLVEETIEIARKEEKERFSSCKSTADAPNALTLSWHTASYERTPEVRISLGGGCPQYYDHEIKDRRIATSEDFLRMVHLAEGIPEIVTVGNAVHYLKESDGTEVAPKMVAILGAAAVATPQDNPP